MTEPYDSLENYKNYQSEEEEDDVEDEEGDDRDGAPGTQDKSTPWPSVASDHLTMPSVQSDYLTMPPDQSDHLTMPPGAATAGWKDLSGGVSNELRNTDQHEVVDEEDEEEGAEIKDPEEEEPEEPGEVCCTCVPRRGLYGTYVPWTIIFKKCFSARAFQSTDAEGAQSGKQAIFSLLTTGSNMMLKLHCKARVGPELE